MFGFKSATIIEHPTGRFGFVGRVPVALGYEREDGAPLTPRDVEVVVQCGGVLAEFEEWVDSR